MTRGQRAFGEGLGTAFLLAIVVGSGIMGERLAGGNVAIALLANSLATGAGLVVLVLVFGPISGAHLNPAVSIAESLRGAMSGADAAVACLAQVGGALAGVVVAHAMFEAPLVALSTHERSGMGQAIAEAVATFGLVAVVLVVPRHRPAATPFAVGAYITSAYWFTSSTSFANPAVTLARAITDTFAGIRLVDVPMFVVAQLVGAGLAVLAFGRFATPAPVVTR